MEKTKLDRANNIRDIINRMQHVLAIVNRPEIEVKSTVSQKDYSLNDYKLTFGVCYNNIPMNHYPILDDELNERLKQITKEYCIQKINQLEIEFREL